MDDHPGAGGAFLPGEPEGGCDHPLCGVFQIRAGIDDDGVFSSHLGHDPFQPDLPRLHLSGDLIDVNADLFGAGK